MMKKKIYKKSLSFLLVITLSVSFSCSDFLQETLPDQFDSNNYCRTVEESVKALYGLYAGVKEVVFGPAYYSVTDLMCDDMDFRGTDQSRRQLCALTFSETNKYFGDIWSRLYKVVNNANLIIKNVPNAEALTEEDENNRNIIVAEAKFIRAWAYFTLVQLWGDVPLSTEPTTSKQNITFPECAPVNDVLTLVLEDLSYAQDYLLQSPHRLIIRAILNSSNDVSYQLTLTQAAVRMLKAKVHLYKKEYQECIDALQFIIENFSDDGKGAYALVQDFGKLFDVRYKRDPDRLKEVVWEIEADSKPGYNNSSHREFAPDQQVNKIAATSGYENHVPSTSLVEIFCFLELGGSIGDKRIAATYRDTRRGFVILKHIDAVTTDQNLGGSNEVLLRIGDAVLIYAEALNQVGRTDEAIVWVNKIRDRAGLIRQVGPVRFGDIKPGTSPNLVNDTILYERRKELAHEGQRLFDLRRTGRLMQALEAYNSNAQRYLSVGKLNFPVGPEVTREGTPDIDKEVPFIKSFKNVNERVLLHPIPTDERRSNPNLKQNPGYY